MATQYHIFSKMVDEKYTELGFNVYFKRGLKSYKENQTAEKWDLFWEAHKSRWFEAAELVHQDFKDEGLEKTAEEFKKFMEFFR